MDDKGVKCVLLGVSEESNAYKLYNLITRKIIISRDVQFDEENTWNWKSTETHQNLVNHDEVYDEIEEQPTSGQRIEPPIQSSDNDNKIEEQLQSPIGVERIESLILK